MAQTRRVEPTGDASELGGPGYELVKRTKDTIERRAMLSEGDTVVVAVSGGPDSTCLLDVLARLASAFDLTLVVGHIDHGLSNDSAQIAASVSAHAARAGYDVHTVRAEALEGPNLQARARSLRYGFLQTVAERTGAGRIATGHTLDDRVETTLARLVHGAGTEGLAGLAPVEGNRIRPLIDSRRLDTRRYCELRSLGFFDDPANLDLRYERAAVRQKLVKSIEEHWGDGAIRAVATSAERLSEDAAALSRLAERVFAGTAKEVEGGVRFPLEALEVLPRALRRRLLETAIGRIRDRSGGVEAALDALDAHKRNVSFAVASGREIVIAGDHVVVEHPFTDSEQPSRSGDVS